MQTKPYMWIEPPELTPAQLAEIEAKAKRITPRRKSLTEVLQELKGKLTNKEMNDLMRLTKGKV
jgi:hypothetical protein